PLPKATSSRDADTSSHGPMYFVPLRDVEPMHVPACILLEAGLCPDQPSAASLCRLPNKGYTRAEVVALVRGALSTWYNTLVDTSQTTVHNNLGGTTVPSTS